MAKSDKGPGLTPLLCGVALLGPLAAFVAVAGVRTGLLEPVFAFETLAMTWGRYLSFPGAAAALAALVVMLGDVRRRWPFAAVAVVGGVGALVLFMAQGARFQPGLPVDVATSPDDAPGFSRIITGDRAADGAIPLGRPQACAAAVTVPTQVTPQRAVAALETAGFRVLGAAAFRAEGLREGFWFAFGHDAVVRIRPGETDVRVSAREAVNQGSEACRLAGEIVAALR